MDSSSSNVVFNDVVHGGFAIDLNYWFWWSIVFVCVKSSHSMRSHFLKYAISEVGLDSDIFFTLRCERLVHVILFDQSLSSCTIINLSKFVWDGSKLWHWFIVNRQFWLYLLFHLMVSCIRLNKLYQYKFFIKIWTDCIKFHKNLSILMHWQLFTIY